MAISTTSSERAMAIEQQKLQELREYERRKRREQSKEAASSYLTTDSSSFISPLLPSEPPRSRIRPKFRLGDRVVIVPTSRYYGQTPNGMPGKVMEREKLSSNRYGYTVVFENEYSNGYYEEDIELIVDTLELIKPKIYLESVILPEEKKEQIKAAISQLENSDLIFKQWGFESVFEKGTAVTLLFWGVPGTGKTLMSQAIAEELGAELKIYGTAEIQSSEPGGAERAIKKIFSEARRLIEGAPKRTVILFDECDSLLYDRNKVGAIMAAQINAMLTEIEKHDGVVIFTTNRMGKLDPALERRITAKIEFPFPDKKQRESIWERMIPSKAPLVKEGKNKVNFKKLSEYPLAGGNIKNVVLNAARRAAYEKAKEISMYHFLDAIEKEIEGLSAFVADKETSPGYETDTIEMGESQTLQLKQGRKKKS